MLEIIAKRLKEMGCETTASDKELLLFCKNKVENYIKNYCNLPAVPDGLTEAFIERVCGEFLLSKFRSGKIYCENPDNYDVKSISEGDVSVTFSENNSVLNLIERLLQSGGSELECYRKIRW